MLLCKLVELYNNKIDFKKKKMFCSSGKSFLYKNTKQGVCVCVCVCACVCVCEEVNLAFCT